jgi:endonuclease III
MTTKGLIPHLQTVFAEQGFIAAVGALIAALVALAISTVKRAFTNEEAVKRIEQSFTKTIERWEQLRKADRDEVREEIRSIHKRLDKLFAQRGGVGQ